MARAQKAVQDAVRVQYGIEAAHVHGGHEGLNNRIDQTPCPKDHEIHEIGPRKLAKAPRRQQRQHKGTNHVKNRPVERIEEREEGVRQRKDDEGNQDQQRAQQSRDAARNESPNAGPAILGHVIAQVVQPVVEEVPHAHAAVNEIRHGVEHAENIPEHPGIVNEHEPENEIRYAADSQHPHVPAHAESLVNAVQEAEQQDRTGHSQHRGGDVVAVNPLQRSPEKLFKIELAHSSPLQKVD